MTENTFQQIMASGTESQKSELLEDLRDTNETEIVPALTQFLEKENSRAVKERIMLILNRLVPLSRFRHIEPMLRSPDPFTRNGGVEIIRHSKYPIIQFVEPLAADGNEDVRKFAIDALAEEKSSRAVEIIRNGLEDPDINIVYTAIEHLGNMKDTLSAERIESLLLASGHVMVTCSALEALAKIEKSPAKDIIIDKFIADADGGMITFPFLKYLGSFGDLGSFSYIENLIDTGPKIFTKEIIDTVDAMSKRYPNTPLPQTTKLKLEKLLETIQNPVDRYAIIKLLSPNGGTSVFSLDKIREMLNAGNDMLKLCAVELLAENGEAEDMERLEQLADQTDSDDLLEAVGDATARIHQRLFDQAIGEE